MFLITAVLSNVFSGTQLYLDPGSGSILIQLVIAAVAAAGIFFATSWRRIKKMFLRRKGESEAVREEDEDDD